MKCDPCTRRELLRAGSAALASLALAASPLARAQSTPATLRILCSAGAGSTPDIVARRVAEQLGGGHFQRAIVENRPGAAAQVAVNALKMFPADGATLMLGAGSVATVNPVLYEKLSYDPAADLQPVSLAAEMPLALAVGPAVPGDVRDLKGFLEWMRRHPQSANIGSPGVGTLPHLVEALLFRQAGVTWQNVTYPGGGQVVVALLGGEIAGLILPEGVLRQHRDAGRLRVLASTAARPTRYMPDVPVFATLDFPDLVVSEWFAFYASGGVPANQVAVGAEAIREAVARPELVAKFAESGIVAVSSTPAEMAKRIVAERAYWEPIIRATGIRVG